MTAYPSDRPAVCMLSLLLLWSCPGCHAEPMPADPPGMTPEAPPIPRAGAGAGAGAGPTTAEGWLDRIEAAADDIDTLTARVRLTQIVGLLEDESQRFGELRVSTADDATRFRVRFDRLRQDGVVEPIAQTYVYDGRWLLDLDGTDRVATRRQLVRGDAAADLELGDGPFLLPLNLKKDRVLQRFTAELGELDDTAPDPPTGDGVVRLVLTPRPGFDADAERLDLWFDTGSDLPLRATATQDDGDITTVDLFRLDPAAEVDSSVFDTALPADPGWETQVVELD
ncbi:MAG: outer membrane lipoprotein carrier protein LolA [Planctomycetota bacterium]